MIILQVSGITCIGLSRGLSACEGWESGRSRQGAEWTAVRQSSHQPAGSADESTVGGN